MREEWWWPWGELPRSLKLAAVNLGYDQYGWQTEEFKHSGQRFYDWEEVEIEREVEIARGGGVVVEDGAGSACSDSELISGHVMRTGGVGAARDMMGSRGWADAMFSLIKRYKIGTATGTQMVKISA